MITTEEFGHVVESLPARPRVICPGSFAAPLEALQLIDEHLPEWTLFCVNAPVGVPTRPQVRHEAIFLGPGHRRAATVDHLPCRLSIAPGLFRTTRRPDLVLLHTSVPRGGKVSMGIEVQIMPGALEAAKECGALVVAVVNEHMPFIRGDGVIDVDDVDLAVQIDAPLRAVPRAVVDDDSAVIGRSVAERVVDGATLQAGIGAVPDAVLGCLAGHRRLGVWTELMTDGVMDLDRAGALDPDRPIVGTFLIGSEELYDWAGRTDRLILLRCETTNLPSRIASQPAMTSINTALQVDLFGQVNATRVGKRIYSGFGGSTDFLVGAMHSPGGQAVIALRSWHAKAHVSTIVGQLDSPTSSVQPNAVVTEQGTAELLGYTDRQQAAALIEHAAHPRAREHLRAEAVRLGLSRPDQEARPYCQT
ncbi:acetyl-CoA hydrolase/transferase family protein [Acidipropionibacterium timonense]|uniref:acetyl-CoA hydrolase/transferase family protein n=1 Tax=Acidipropionibacterium timonense TaxID=2161818 RepID=UPI00398C5BEF